MKVARLKKLKSKSSDISYFSKSYKLRAITIIFNILKFAKKYRLRLINNKLKSNKNYYNLN